MAAKTPEPPTIDIHARDSRMLRAAKVVLEKYQFVEKAGNGDGLTRFTVRGGTSLYELVIDPHWKNPPTCTCPDFEMREYRDHGGFCKHIIGALLKKKEFQYQLLDLFL